jgi:hypothetical protein
MQRTVILGLCVLVATACASTNPQSNDLTLVSSTIRRLIDTASRTPSKRISIPDLISAFCTKMQSDLYDPIDDDVDVVTPTYPKNCFFVLDNKKFSPWEYSADYMVGDIDSEYAKMWLVSLKQYLGSSISTVTNREVSMTVKFLRTLAMYASQYMTRSHLDSTSVPLHTYVSLLRPDIWSVTFLVGSPSSGNRLESDSADLSLNMDTYTPDTYHPRSRDFSQGSWTATLTIRI